jgi:hypothetical protein
MGVVIEICIKYPGSPTRIRGTDMSYNLHSTHIYKYVTFNRFDSETATKRPFNF